MKKALLVLIILLALPATARAANVTMVARDVPLGPRALEAAAAPIAFDMLGLHWQGAGAVSYRTLGTHGWSVWATADADSGPDPGSTEALKTAGWHDGNLDWTGESTRIQFKTSGNVTRLRAYYLSSRVVRDPTRSLSVAGSPPIVTRGQWQADEKIVRAKPLYASKLLVAVVHHTANTNNYTPAQAAAIVRGIEVYHVQGNGWNDIGYNFLIDRYGTIYEGRGGGITRNVIGAHALGFNTGTVGVALIGDFNTATPPPAMQAALVKLLAWRLDIAHIDPRSTVAYTSGGNAKFRAGKVVTLRAISGHRDTGPSECPGNDAYALLPLIAKRVSLTGLPKLYSPVVSGVLGGNVRFQARLSGSLPWSVTVTNAAGKLVTRHSGRSQTIDWTWSSAGAGKGPFAWAIASGKELLPATGSLGGKLPAPVPAPQVTLLTNLAATPSVLTLNADGTGLVSAVGFTLAAQAQVTATAGSLQLMNGTAPAGANNYQWDLSALPDGRYTLTVTAKANGTTTSQTTAVVIDRTLSGLTTTPVSFSPNGDGVNDTIAFGFVLSQNVPVQVTVERAGVPVATVFNAQLGPGFQTVNWDGTSGGVRLPDGQYTAVVTTTDPLATVSLLAPFAIDTVPPTLAVVNGAALQFQLSEPATVTAVIDGQTYTASEPAGTFAFPYVGAQPTAWTLSAKDAAGNATATITGP
ncbi:MAG TPA: N-acetylmuramoyl-L-alanine amidase [Gaiellaceae bacterium]